MSQPRPILLSTDALDLFDGELGEVADTCAHLLRTLAERGVCVDVLTPGKPERVERREGGTVFRHAIGCAASCAPPSAEAIAARKYGLVHTTAAGPLGLLSRGIARSSGARFVVGYHAAVEWSLRRGSAVSCGMEAGGASISRLLDCFYDSADLVLAPTRATRNALAARLKAPVAVLGRGVDPDAFHPGLRTRAHGGPLRALYTGWMADREELNTLVRVFGDRDDIELVMAGDGPLRSTLEELLPRATFPGTLQGTERSRSFADADVFVVPSRTDASDHVLLQALSSGVPVVAFSGIGRDEIIQDGVSGVIVHDDAAFAAAVSFLAADENARLEMGLEARRQATRSRWETVVDGLLSLYAALTSDRPPLVA